MAVDIGRTTIPELPRGGPSKQYVLDFAGQMIERYRTRNDDYDVLVNAWHGIYYGILDRMGDMDTQGRPLLRDHSRELQSVPTTVNMLKGFTDKYKAMLVGLPDQRFPRPGRRFTPDLDGQRQAETYQNRMRRAGYGIWAASKLDLQQIEAAWWDTVCGGHYSLIWPDFERMHAVIRYAAPWQGYVIGKASDPILNTRGIIVEDLDPASADDEEPGVGGSRTFTSPLTADTGTSSEAFASGGRGERTIRRIWYFDENYYMRITGDHEDASDYTGLGFCPILFNPFILLPRQRNRAHSVAEQAIPMQLSSNYAVSLWEAGMKQAIFKTPWVKDAVNMPENFRFGTGLAIQLGKDGAIGEVGGDPQALKAVVEHVNLMRSLIEINTGVSRAALEGRLSGGGPTSGRGIEKSMTPYLAGVEEIQNTQAIFKSAELAMAIKMTANAEFWDAMPDDTVCFEGLLMSRNQYVDEEFTREELDGAPPPQIIYAPMAHLGLHERINLALQLFNAKPAVLSWQRIVEITGLVDDIDELRKQIQSDYAWRMQIAAMEVQAQQGGGGGGGGQQGDPGAEAAAREAGATNPATLRRAGAGQPAATPAPGAEIPSAGAPVPTPGEPSTSGGVTPSALADLSKLFENPPDAPKDTPSGFGEDRSFDDEIRAVLSSIPLRGDAFLAGKTLFVEWQDVKRVKDALSYEKGLTIRAKSSKTPNWPSSAARVGEAKDKPGEKKPALAGVGGAPGAGS